MLIWYEVIKITFVKIICKIDIFNYPYCLYHNYHLTKQFVWTICLTRVHELICYYISAPPNAKPAAPSHAKTPATHAKPPAPSHAKPTPPNHGKTPAPSPSHEGAPAPSPANFLSPAPSPAKSHSLKGLMHQQQSGTHSVSASFLVIIFSVIVLAFSF